MKEKVDEKTFKEKASDENDKQETNVRYNQRIKKEIEDRTERNIISFNEFSEKVPEFAKWVKYLTPFDRVDDYLFFFQSKSNSERFIVKLFTNEYEYTISAKISSNNKNNGYLGAFASKRKPNVGENWTRGRDLPDGEYNEETFRKISFGIIQNELKKIEVWK